MYNFATKQLFCVLSLPNLQTEFNVLSLSTPLSWRARRGITTTDFHLFSHTAVVYQTCKFVSPSRTFMCEVILHIRSQQNRLQYLFSPNKLNALACTNIKHKNKSARRLLCSSNSGEERQRTLRTFSLQHKRQGSIWRRGAALQSGGGEEGKVERFFSSFWKKSPREQLWQSWKGRHSRQVKIPPQRRGGNTTSLYFPPWLRPPSSCSGLGRRRGPSLHRETEGDKYVQYIKILFFKKVLIFLSVIRYKQKF